MISAKDEILRRFKAAGVDPNQSTFTEAEFQLAGIPMVVRCTSCDMTMVCFSAFLDSDGRTYCERCADADA